MTAYLERNSSGRAAWLAVLAGLLAAIAMPVALPSAVQAREPLRSGTITGWGYTWPAMFSGEGRNCQWDEWAFHGVRGANPECHIWLDSDCDPGLAGRDPAVTASIEDVSDLADGRTTRTFRWEAARGGEELTIAGAYGGVVLQFWDADCTEVPGTEWRSVDRQGSYCSWRRCYSWTNESSTSFVIPSTSTWMTVTTNDTHRVRWTLT